MAGCGFVSPEVGRTASGSDERASWRQCLFESGLRFETSPFSDLESFPEGGGALVVSGTVSRGQSFFKSGFRFDASPFSDLKSFLEGSGALVVGGTVSLGQRLS